MSKEKEKEIEKIKKSGENNKINEKHIHNEINKEIKANHEKTNYEKNKETGLLKIQLEESTDKLKRVMAEFENFKKRNEKEREILYNCILSDIVIMFLPIVDNLEKAIISETKDELYKQGIELLLKQVLDLLEKLRSRTNTKYRRKF